MSSPVPQFPEYGDGGDLIGARRARRAFRWGVALVVAFTAMLYVTEQFWRYPNADRLYLSALTLRPEQGRNLLRQAVIYDERDTTPSSRYLEALAEREEDDLVISAYEQASRLDPENADLSIKFGCELFSAGQPLRARELFRKATESGTHNALAVYLEAAVLPFVDAESPDLEGALRILEQANGSGDAVTFPRPMWFPSLRRSGYWYAQLRRQMVQHCGAPIERLAERILESSERDLLDPQAHETTAKLLAMEAMGRRIAQGALPIDGNIYDLAGGSPQLYLGLRTMALAAEQRKRVAQALGGTAPEALVTDSLRYETALKDVGNFEAQRMRVIEEERAKYAFPLELAELGVAALFAAFLAAYLVGKVLNAAGPANSVRHSQMARASWALYFGATLCVFLLISAMQRLSYGALPAQNVLAFVWWIPLIVAVAAACVIPAFTLPSVETVLQRLPVDQRGSTSVIRARRRAASISLVRRSLGILLGLLLCAICVWIVCYRIYVGSYPWMTPLLVTGLETEELALIGRTLASVAGN